MLCVLYAYKMDNQSLSRKVTKNKRRQRQKNKTKTKNELNVYTILRQKYQKQKAYQTDWKIYCNFKVPDN